METTAVVSAGKLEYWQKWIGETDEAADVADPLRVAALAATLDAPAELVPAVGDPVPPVWHWMFFWPLTPLAEVGNDGHPRRGGFLPPVDLPRRMWAGSRLSFVAPIPVGADVRRTSRIADVRHKAGKREPLVFVTVEHRIRANGIEAVIEEQDIVYRPAPTEAAPDTSPPDARPALWERPVTPEAVLLFRYSALTFNGHRIHYDRTFCREQEGYPGLVVHGPLTATLLLELVRTNLPRARVARFAFRAMRPIFDTSPFVVRAQQTAPNTILAWAVDNHGRTAMEATVDLV